MRSAFGAVLPLLERTKDWVRVLAPETTRAYVSDRFVHVLGPLSQHTAVVEAARAVRRKRVEAHSAERREAAAQASGERLRAALGDAQQALYRLRIHAGLDRAPVVVVINALEAAMAAGRMAPVDVRKLAGAIRADLEAEIELRQSLTQVGAILAAERLKRERQVGLHDFVESLRRPR